VRAYFARQGFFALRSVSYRFEDEEGRGDESVLRVVLRM
jgi:hypothetical protein